METPFLLRLFGPLGRHPIGTKARQILGRSRFPQGWFALGVLLAFAPRSGAAVAQLGSPYSNYGTATIIASFTVGAGTDRLLVVAVGDPATATNPTTVTYLGTAMTKANGTSDSASSNDSIWYLPLGSGSAVTGNIVVTFVGSSNRFIGVSTYSGVDQTTPVDLNGPKISGSVAGSGNSLSVSSQTGSLVFDLFDSFRQSAATTMTAGAGQTLVNDASGATLAYPGFGHYLTSTKAGATSVTMAWTGNAEYVLHLTMNIRATAVPAPSVTGISPTSGTTAGGTSVTITGTNLTGATAVTIGGTAATAVSVTNSTTVTCTTPAHAAGTASVLVTTPGGTNSANSLYTYITPDSTPPTVTSIVRQLPSTAQAINSTSATFRVTFSEAVNPPTTANFAVARVGSGNSIAGTVVSVTSFGGSTSIYDVAVTLTSGTGEFRLLVKD